MIWLWTTVSDGGAGTEPVLTVASARLAKG